MAAPSNAYRTKTVRLQKESEVTHLLAILQVDKATHLDRFYLDDILPVRLEDGTAGVIGIADEGSNNFYMHNTSRHGSGRHGSEGIWLNDGGLNTLGTALINNVNLYWANNVRINLTHRSAWYVNTIQYGLQYRLVGTTPWTTLWVGGSLPQQQQNTANWIFDTIQNPGQNIQVRATLTNPEGTYYSDPVVVNLLDRVYEYDALFRTTACSDVGQVNITFWVKEDAFMDLSTVTEVAGNTGIFFWKNIELTTKADQGWYMGLSGDKAFYVNSGGEVTHYQSCPVAPPIVTVAIEEDFEGNMQVWAFMTVALAHDITIVGRVDVQPMDATPAGTSFSIFIPAGQQSGTDSSFAMERNPGITYYWVGLGSTPGGVVVNGHMPI